MALVKVHDPPKYFFFLAGPYGSYNRRNLRKGFIPSEIQCQGATSLIINHLEHRFLYFFSFTIPFIIVSFLGISHKYKRNMNKYFLVSYLSDDNIHIHMKTHIFRILWKHKQNLKNFNVFNTYKKLYIQF